MIHQWTDSYGVTLLVRGEEVPASARACINCGTIQARHGGHVQFFNCVGSPLYMLPACVESDLFRAKQREIRGGCLVRDPE